MTDHPPSDQAEPVERAHTAGRIAFIDNRDLNDAFWLVLEDDDLSSIAEVRHGHDEIDGCERANADRLALAWNSHDVLVTALKCITDLAERIFRNGEIREQDMREAIANARAALAAAEGGERHG